MPRRGLIQDGALARCKHGYDDYLHVVLRHMDDAFVVYDFNEQGGFSSGDYFGLTEEGEDAAWGEFWRRCSRWGPSYEETKFGGEVVHVRRPSNDVQTIDFVEDGRFKWDSKRGGYRLRRRIGGLRP